MLPCSLEGFLKTELYTPSLYRLMAVCAVYSYAPPAE